MNLSLWQSTALSLLGFAAGLVLHLRWHPLRRHLSDAWDLLRLRPALVLLCATALLLAALSGPTRAPYALEQLADWQEIIRPLALSALAHLAVLPHEAVPAWPLAGVAPVLLVFLTVRIWRWPYRYRERRQGVEQKLALLAATLAGFAWLALEVRGLRHMLPEGIEMLRLGLRYVFTALAAASLQVWLVRYVIAWEKPQAIDAGGDAAAALEHVFARWQGVAWLSGFDLLWMSWRWWQMSTPKSIGAWGWVELLLLCVALPVAVAAVPGPFWRQGAVALRVLGRCALSLLMLGVTALAFLILGTYAVEMVHALCGDSQIWRILGLPLGALVLAMLDCWLLLAALLTMLRLGFSRSTSA